jgi:small-conductance mechanosensitive channel
MDWASPLLIYEASVAAVGVYVLLRVLRSTAQVQVRNLRVMRGRVRRSPQPVPTDSPLDAPQQAAADRATEAIEAQTTIARRTVIPLVLIGLVIAMAVPAMPQVPANLVTIVAAIVTVVVGVAARPVVENIIAGLVIARSKVFNVGDTIKTNEHYGIIEDIRPTHTVIKLWDWRRYVVPNSEMVKHSAENYSLNDPFLWASVDILVDYGTDLDELQRLAVKAMKESEHLGDYEDPQFWVMGLEERSVRCMVAGWADSPGDGWMLTSDTRANLVPKLTKAGIRTHRFEQRGEGPAPAAAVS